MLIKKMMRKKWIKLTLHFYSYFHFMMIIIMTRIIDENFRQKLIQNLMLSEIGQSIINTNNYKNSI